MDEQLQRVIVQNYPHATRILDVRSFRPGYLPYPARVTLQTTTGDTVSCVLKLSEQTENLIYEAHVLRALAELELAVPRVIAGPVTVAETLEPLTILLLSELPGQPLPWIGLTDLMTADQTCRLVHTAVERLHALTPAVMAHQVANRIPSRTLEAEAQDIRARAGAWMRDPFFCHALDLVQTAIPRYPSPLVFSNGDYNPLNFLAADNELVGWIDFEHTCFEDPSIGFAKFLLWADDSGWSAGARVGLVERFLYTHQVSPTAFLVRLVLRGLFHLQDSSPLRPPAYMLRVIRTAVQQLEHALDTHVDS